MSKNIKGKNLDININITQAGTMNADIFNAYQDFTLNGVSIVNRIATNEGDIALLNTEVINLQDEINENETDIATNTSDIATNTTDIATLQTSKQDVLTFDSTPTAGSNNPVSSQGIKTYVDNSTPTITANLPLDYSSATGVIRGIFDSVPTNSSINFLNSNVIYDALQLKQDEITSSTNLTTGNIGVVGNLTAQGGVSGASLFTTGLITGTNIQLNNSAGNQITCLGTGNSVFSDVLCGDITASGNIGTNGNITCNTGGSITTTSGQIATTSGSISTSSGDIITSTGDITAPSGTISAGTISATGASGTITAPIIIQGTTNLLNEINTKQDVLTFDTAPTAGSTNPVTSQGIKTYVDNSTPSITATAPINYSGGVISGTFDNTPTQASINFLSSDKIFYALSLKQDLITASTNITCDALTASSLTTSGTLTLTGGNPIVNAGVYNGVGNIISSAGNVIGDNFITNSGTNVVSEINTKQDLITASTPLTCGDLTATGTGNDIDLRNNLVGGNNITLTQSGSTTTIENSSLPISNDVLGRSNFYLGGGGFNVTFTFTSLWTSFVTPSSASTNLAHSYIVKEAGSQISVTFDVACYEITGFGADEYLSRLRYRYYNGTGWTGWAVCSNEGRDRWRDGEYRGGQLFPITAVITTNASMINNPIQFEAQAGRGGGDDTFNLQQRGAGDFNVFTFEVTESRLYNGTPSNSYTNISTAVTLGSLTTSSGNIISGGDIETSSGNIISGGDIETSSGNFLVTNSGDVECGDLQAENLTINNNLNGQPFIRNVAMAKVLANGTNVKTIGCSITNTGTGRYTFSFPPLNPRPSSDYVVQLTTMEDLNIRDDVIIQVIQGSMATTGFNYFIHEQDNGGSSGVLINRNHYVLVVDTD